MLLAEVADETFSNFLRAQRDFRGFTSWDSFAKSALVGVASVYRVLDDGPDGQGTHLNTRNQIAKALGFSDWKAMVGASRLSPSAMERIAEAAALMGVTPDEYVSRVIRIPETSTPAARPFQRDRSTPPPRKPAPPKPPPTEAEQIAAARRAMEEDEAQQRAKKKPGDHHNRRATG